MAAKGTESKNSIFQKLQEIYPDSFWEDQGKILRIPLDENGSRVEIKVSLTAAKTNLGDETVKSAFEASSPFEKSAPNIEKAKEMLEPTQEEKDNISKLIASLGL